MVIVSCYSKVPALIEEFKPDTVLSISKKIVVPDHIKHYFLEFADIVEPTTTNVHLAATKQHIELIKSISYTNLLIHCTQGQSRSPAAALILLGGCRYNEMYTKAPYIRPNKWMLKLAGIKPTPQRPPCTPPKDCYFMLEEMSRERSNTIFKLLE